ncbi:phosphoglycerate mutase-like protein, partial [Nadsonia fulvescens var. elongata DSM 6958]
FPDTCSLEQVHTLHRHAERHPTARVGVNLIKFSKKLKEAVNVSRYLGELEWLKSWNYTLDTEHLMPKGFQTQFESGRTYWENYGKLIYKANKYSCPKEGFNIGNSKNRAKVNIPVIRATDQERIRASAEAWASGFFGEGSDFASNDDVSDCYTMVLQSESVGTNNTLSCGYSCPNFHNYKYYPGRVKNAEWVDIYLTDAVLRLQNHLPEFKNLTNGDVYHMQNLCAFETAFYGSSKFCGLFTDEEWAGYEYAADLIFYHGYSFGSRFGQARGAGWVTEFLARLEKEHINIPKNGFYLDMSHDIDIVSVLATMRFDFLKSAFPSSHMDPTRQFVSSRLVPFGSRLNFEVLQCETGKYIRAKINDRVLPLASLGDCGENRQGLCEYEKFIRGLQDCLDIANFDNVC